MLYNIELCQFPYTQCRHPLKEFKQSILAESFNEDKSFLRLSILNLSLLNRNRFCDNAGKRHTIRNHSTAIFFMKFLASLGQGSYILSPCLILLFLLPFYYFSTLMSSPELSCNLKLSFFLRIISDRKDQR